MTTKAEISAMMREFGQRNKGRPVTAVKRKAILRNATKAWLTRVLKAFARRDMSPAAAVKLAMKRPTLKKNFTARQIAETYKRIQAQL